MRWMTCLVSLLVTPAVAAGLDCKAANDQTAMNMCADRDRSASDRRLNETYQALLKKVGKDGAAKLQAAQRAWIAYRDAQCDFDTLGTANGSVHPMILAMCLDGLTRGQTQELSAQLRCQEGDLSCGGQ